jgi:hypothetical protein
MWSISDFAKTLILSVSPLARSQPDNDRSDNENRHANAYGPPQHQANLVPNYPQTFAPRYTLVCVGPEFSNNGVQISERGYPTVFRKLRGDLSSGSTRHCEEPLRRSNPVLLVARAVWIASLRSQ